MLATVLYGQGGENSVYLSPVAGTSNLQSFVTT